MPISAVGGVETSQTYAATLLQALEIVEATSLWTWGALLLAVAATLASILNTHKLTGFIPWDAAGADDSLRLIPSTGSKSDDAGASDSSAAQLGEKDKGSERVELKAAPARRIVPDSDRRTKGQQLWMGEEDQAESVGGEDWDISSREVVKLWPQDLRFRGGDLTISQTLLINDCQRRPVVVISGGGDIQVCDQRASGQSPVISAYRLSPQKPVSEVGYDGTGKIFFRYRGSGSGGGCRDDVVVRDLRMLGPNCDGRASSDRRCDTQWWEEDAVIVPNEHEHGKSDEFQIVGYEWSLDATNSRSMVFRCLDAVRSISSGLMN